MKVFIGVGHGGKDPGAVANNLKESNINLSISLACRDELVRHGVQVLMSRTIDEEDTLTEEIKECNTYGPDCAVDIHTNAGGGDGFEAFHSKATNGLGKRLAELIEKEVIAIGQNSRGVNVKLNSKGKDYYGFVRNTNCPAVIVEGAFIDTPDIGIMDTVEEQNAFGVAYAKGILKYLGIEWKPIEPDYRSLYEEAKHTLDQIRNIGGWLDR